MSLDPEQQARQTIDGMLLSAGWLIQNVKQFNPSAGLGVAVREYHTDNGPADYVLFVERKPVGVIEAKKEGVILTPVEEQTGKYAQSRLRWQQQGQPLPFLYESTGVETHFTDNRDPAPRARDLFHFHRPDQLREWMRQSDTLRSRLIARPSLPEQGLRDCQIKAVRNLETSFAQNRPRSLIQMATGAGKTFTAITAAYRLLKFAGAKRILFLVDTKNLGEQAETEFQAFVPNDDLRGFRELYNVQRLQSSFIDPSAQVCISTIQRMYSVLKGTELDDSAEETSLNELTQTGPPKDVAYNSRVPVETFDFIIIDECHRSIYNIWQQVLDYFDAFLIGLTATPDARTYGFFNKNVVSEYTYERAVADGVNVPYDVYTIETEITSQGASMRAKEYIELRSRQSRRKRWEQLDEPLDYSGRQLDRDVVNPDQIRTIVREFHRALREEIFPLRRNEQGQYEVPKTLIFAKTDTHAEDIIRIVREEFGEGNAFCKKVTYGNKEEKASAVLQQFRTAYYPRIAVTVDMIATGTDVKSIECLLFMRDVKSRSYFEQMKGRGTRTLGSDDLRKVTPSAVGNKTHFVIVDAIGVTKSLKTDSRPLERKPSVSLKDLMMGVVMGDRSEDTLLSVASRLTRLEKQLSPDERSRFTELAGGVSINQIVNRLLEVDNPDCQEQKVLVLHPEAEEGYASAWLDEARDKLADEATRPFDSAELRDYIETVRRQHDQVIDHLNLDIVRFSGWDVNARDGAAELVTQFRTYLETHKDEITALQLFYGEPYRRRELTYRLIKELFEKLKTEQPVLMPARIWLAYQTLEDVKVPSPKSELVALVSLIRRVLEIDAELMPYDQTVGRNFQTWVFGKQAGSLKFSDEQMTWLRMMRDFVAGSFHLDRSAFEYSPFAERGGLGRIWQLFGDDTYPLIDELNEALAA
ncbi:type I restriction endonuclease subunit R [Spirosoma pulveris]